LTVNGTDSTLGAGPNGGSEFTVGVSEDLGNGLKANGAITLITSIATAKDVSSYNSFVGLSGEFGSVKLGAQFNPVFLASTIGDATGRWNSSGEANPYELQNGQSLTYTSPSVSGISISYQKQMLGAGATSGAGNANANGNVNSSAYSVNYAAGGFAAAYASSKDTTYGNSSIIAASYDFGAAKVHVGNLRTTFDADAAATATTTSNSFGVSAPVGNAVLSAMYSSDSTDTVTNLAAMYNLSKRTSVYVNYATGSSTVSTTFAGIKHAF
jgi:predicted porin